MKKLIYSLILLVFLTASNTSFAQKDTKSDFGVKFSGFVKNDAFFDTRETVAAREGHFNLYPRGEVMDMDGNDIYDGMNFNMLAIQTRLRAKITAPDVLGAKTTGMVEGAFFGMSNNDVNGFRLRHAFLKLDWGNTALLFGQTWNPMFITECFPGTVSFNTGVPFQPFSRNPQIRWIQKFGVASIELAAYTQQDFTTPNGGRKLLSNSGLPGFGAQFKVKPGKHAFGAAIDFKMLKPESYTRQILVEDEPATTSIQNENTINSFSALAFAKVQAGNLTLKAEGVMGQNLADMLSLSSWAVKSVDPETGELDYIATKNMSAWADIIYNVGNVDLAVFAGYTAYLGADENLASRPYGLYVNETTKSGDLESLLRVSPRLVWKASKNVRFGAEIEYMSAAFGEIDLNDKGKINDTETISNIRTVLSFYLFF